MWKIIANISRKMVLVGGFFQRGDWEVRSVCWELGDSCGMDMVI